MLDPRSVARFATLTLSLALLACGARDPESLLAAGQDQAAASDYSSALSSFDAVLANESATDSQKFQAARDRVAMAGRVGGENAASDAFSTLEKNYRARLDVDALAKIAQDLADAGLKGVTMEVFETAAARVAEIEDPAEQKRKDALLKTVSKKLVANADPATLEKLKALGYVGNTE